MPGELSGNRDTQFDTDAIRTVADFAARLTDRRLAVGLSVRDVARLTTIPASTLGGYFSGRHLPPPTRPEVLSELLAALQVPPEQRRAWHEVVRQLSRARAGGTFGASPFPGLAAFDTDHAESFHGRDQLVVALLSQVTDTHAGMGGVVVVTGVSGSGKSSLLNAGLLPRLPGWSTAVCTPSSEPLSTVTAAIDFLDDGTARPACLVVDQLEQLWASGVSAQQRSEAIAAVLGWAGRPERRRQVAVLGLRADYYAAASEIPDLLPALREGQLLVGPMTPAELRDAITKPVEGAGGRMDTGLAEVIVMDCQTSSRSGHAAVLPHLSHCLTTMWADAQGGPLTLQGYHDVGGVAGAVSRSAEEAYAGLKPHAAARAQQLLLRMVCVEEGLPAAAVPIGLADLSEPDRALVNRFAAQRLLTVDVDSVRLSHEALIESWPRLRTWLDEGRTVLLQRRAITRDAIAWETSSREPELLLRGSRLAAAREWPDTTRSLLTPLEQDFVSSSEAYADARALRERRRRSHLRWVAALTSVVSVLALASSVGYLATNRTLTLERDAAESRQLAVISRTVGASDSAVGHQLAVAAYDRAPTAEARAALLDATAEPAVTRVGGPVGYRVAAVHSGRHLLAVAGAQGAVGIYDVSGAPRKLADGPAPVADTLSSTVFAVAFSPDGQRLALGGDDKRVRVLDVSDPQRPVAVTDDLPTAGTVYALAFASGSTLLAGTTGGVQQWTVADHGATPAPTLALAGVVQSLALAPSGAVVAGTDRGALGLWPAGSAGSTEPAAVVTVAATPISSLAFAPDGSVLAGAHDRRLRRLAVSGAGFGPVSDIATLGSWVTAIATSGPVTVAGSSDNTVRVWRDGTDADGFTVTFPSPVTSATFVSDSELAVATTNGEVDLVDIGSQLARRGSAGVFAVGFDQTGRRLLVGQAYAVAAQPYEYSPGVGALPAGPGLALGTTSDPLNGPGAISPDGGLVVLATRGGAVDGVDITDPQHPRLAFHQQVSAKMPEQVAFDGSGTSMVVAGDDAVVHVLDVAGDAVHESAALAGATDALIGAAISSDGSLVAAASLDTSVRLWRRGPDGWTLAATVAGSGPVFTVAFDATANRLAAGGSDHQVRVWDISRPTDPTQLAVLTGPGNDVYQVGFSPSGELAAASLDKTVTIWQPDPTVVGQPASTSYTRWAVLRQANANLYSLAWSADGAQLAGGGANGVVTVWQTDVEAARGTVCRLAGDPIAPEEWATVVTGIAVVQPCAQPSANQP